MYAKLGAIYCANRVTKTPPIVDDLRAWLLTTLGLGGPKVVRQTPLDKIGLLTLFSGSFKPFSLVYPLAGLLNYHLADGILSQ